MGAVEVGQGLQEAVVGRVVVRRNSRSEGPDHRSATSEFIDIERNSLPLVFTRAQIVAIAVSLFLATALLVLTIVASRTPPGIWLAPLIVLGGSAWIAYQRTRRSVLRVDGESITAIRPWSREQIAICDVEGFGVGAEHPHRTLWVAARGRGRVLMLDGLSNEEAELALRTLQAALPSGET